MTTCAPLRVSGDRPDSPSTFADAGNTPSQFAVRDPVSEQGEGSCIVEVARWLWSFLECSAVRLLADLACCLELSDLPRVAHTGKLVKDLRSRRSNNVRFSL